jgi:hypothetical protein
MKTHNTEFKVLQIEAYKSFHSLWNSEDPDWILNRQDGWAQARGEAQEPCLALLERYYVYGEEPPEYVIQEDGERLHIPFRFLDRVSFMPFETGDQVVDFWNATLGVYQSDYDRRHEEMLFIGEHLAGFPERDGMVELITKTLFTADYFMCPAKSKFVPEGTLASISPLLFVNNFAEVFWFYDKENKHEVDYRIFSIDYFVQCVRYCEEAGQLTGTPGREKMLPGMYEELLQLDDSELSGYRAELKQKLIELAEDENAPTALRDAFRKARGY